jgi:LPS sulfotransferase NodH
MPAGGARVYEGDIAMNGTSFADLVKDIQVDRTALKRDLATIVPSDREYVIFFTPRSGSSWLTSILSMTNKLGYPEEYINPDFVRDVVKATNAWTPGLLLQMLKRKRKTPNGVFGMEVRANDVLFFGEREFFDEVDPGAVIYFLWRSNIVAQGISLYRAVLTGRFHSSDKEVPAAPAYSADSIRHWIQHIANIENANLEMLERHDLAARLLCYEDIVGDRAGALALFAETLGIGLEVTEHSQRSPDELSKISDAWNLAAEERFRREEQRYVYSVEEQRRITCLSPHSTATLASALAIRCALAAGPLSRSTLVTPGPEADKTPEPPTEVSRPDHQGKFYQNCLRELHQAIRPKTYLEIGTLNGDTLNLASCHSIAVDPAFQLSTPPIGNKPSLHMFQMSSDSFFANYDPKALLHGPIDLAFLDGMHLFEFLLRDFIHTERACHAGSVIVLHDCVPLDPFMATRDVGDQKSRSRSRYPLWWTGDVWKLVPILHHYRSDLTVTLFDSPPTGLALVTDLDPTNRVLSEHYAAILAPRPGSAWADAGIDSYLSSIMLRPTAELLDSLPSHRAD